MQRLKILLLPVLQLFQDMQEGHRHLWKEYKVKLKLQIVEQLEEAINQIDKKTNTGSRLALILIDNSLEIAMYNLIKKELSSKFEVFSEDDLKLIDPDTNYSTFKEKTNFLLTKKIITLNQKNIMDICHKYRNESYHTNILRDSIIQCISKVYLQTCCDIMPQLLDWGLIISNHEPFPQILSKYGIKYDWQWTISEEDFNKIMNCLCENRKCSRNDFSEVLSSDIIDRVENLYKEIGYIEIFLNYKIPDYLKKLHSYKKRSEKIKNEKLLSQSLVKYNNLDRDLIKIEVDVNLFSGLVQYLEDVAIDEYGEKRYEKQI